jgi:hypothetical protein
MECPVPMLVPVARDMRLSYLSAQSSAVYISKGLEIGIAKIPHLSCVFGSSVPRKCI